MMAVMGSAHFFYIPLCILVGCIAGFSLGRKAGIAFIEQQQELAERRERRRAARAERAAEADETLE